MCLRQVGLSLSGGGVVGAQRGDLILGSGEGSLKICHLRGPFGDRGACHLQIRKRLFHLRLEEMVGLLCLLQLVTRLAYLFAHAVRIGFRFVRAGDREVRIPLQGSRRLIR